jgi:hypothetical protein
MCILFLLLCMVVKYWYLECTPFSFKHRPFCFIYLVSMAAYNISLLLYKVTCLLPFRLSKVSTLFLIIIINYNIARCSTSRIILFLCSLYLHFILKKKIEIEIKTISIKASFFSHFSLFKNILMDFVNYKSNVIIKIEEIIYYDRCTIILQR